MKPKHYQAIRHVVLFAVLWLGLLPSLLRAQDYSWRNFVGLPGGNGNVNGNGNAARFHFPGGVAVDASGNVYVADTDNHTIRKVTPAGVVTTLAGSAETSGSTDGTGSDARFYYPGGVAVDSSGNVYVADTWNNSIRKVTPAGVVTTLAGSAETFDSTDGTGSAARFNYPRGVAVDAGGNVYVADTNNHTIRKVTPAGVVTTLVGSAGNRGGTDGTGSAARFYHPSDVAVDVSGNLYVADEDNHTIRKVTPAGVVTTLVGSAGNEGRSDGTGSAARFESPGGVSVDAGGTLYVADTFNHTIRKVTSAGVVTTIGGLAGEPDSPDGVGSAARFTGPSGVAVDASGNIYVADPSNHRISRGVPGGGPSTGYSVIIISITREAGKCTLLVNGKTGATYQLQRRADLASGAWETIRTVGPVATDGPLTIEDLQAPPDRAFYRIAVTGL